jgi:hypothetical protein
MTRSQICAIGAFIVLLYTWVLLPDPLLSASTKRLVSQEDGLVECLGALSLLAGSGLFFVCFLRARRGGSERLKQLFLVGLAVALLIGAGEEMSWGQRVLSIETPEVVKRENNQEELTLHNVSVFGQHDAEPGRIWRAFEIFTLLFMVGLPLTAWRNRQTGAALARYVPIVSLACAGLFLLVELMVALSQFAYPRHWVDPSGSVTNDVLGLGPQLWQGGSTTETALSLLWAVAALEVMSNSRRRRRTPTVTGERTRGPAAAGLSAMPGEGFEPPTRGL